MKKEYAETFTVKGGGFTFVVSNRTFAPRQLKENHYVVKPFFIMDEERYEEAINYEPLQIEKKYVKPDLVFEIPEAKMPMHDRGEQPKPGLRGIILRIDHTKG
uniref:Uncharacterized protein n=1 Tax=Cucumis melo TaxID=3656 RepID=A0A9I9EKD1_CUCME